ncbi:hypothetical protein J6590_092869 [Homalodisca vitripennis]|nr:hypothetical protein J6590_092869 [Homalodisca vitripennis]
MPWKEYLDPNVANHRMRAEGQRAVGRLMPRCCRFGAGTAVSGHFLTEHGEENIRRCAPAYLPTNNASVCVVF